MRRWIGIAALALASPVLAEMPPVTVPAADCPPVPVSAGGPSTRASDHVATAILPALTGTATRPATLAERMRALKVPGVSVAYFRDGRVEWARGWGVRDAGTCRPVTPDTLFQAASISKVVAGVLALRAVEAGRLRLDEDVNTSLKRWRLPAAPAFPPGTVTLRQLLNHTAGTSVFGFHGYAPGMAVPTLMQTLAGTAPAIEGPVRITAQPGGEWRYSGGGYEIIEAALADAEGKPYAELAAEQVLRPLGMTRSSYAQPLTPALAKGAAAGHDKGAPFALKANVYPELAAAGLWTTPSDLARLLIAVQKAAAGQPNPLLGAGVARAMTTPGKNDWGLGVATWGKGAQRRFGHYGGNWGFLSVAWSYLDRGEGLVVMANGEGGIALAEEITHAVANDRGWTEMASRPLLSALTAQPIYLRGSMNNWSTASPLAGSGPDRSVEVALPAGTAEFKIASADWSALVLGAEEGAPLMSDGAVRLLQPGGDNVRFSVTSAGRYRFVLLPEESGAATLRVTRVGD